MKESIKTLLILVITLFSINNANTFIYGNNNTTNCKPSLTYHLNMLYSKFARYTTYPEQYPFLNSSRKTFLNNIYFLKNTPNQSHILLQSIKQHCIEEFEAIENSNIFSYSKILENAESDPYFEVWFSFLGILLYHTNNDALSYYNEDGFLVNFGRKISPILLKSVHNYLIKQGEYVTTEENVTQFHIHTFFFITLITNKNLFNEYEYYQAIISIDNFIHNLKDKKFDKCTKLFGTNTDNNYLIYLLNFLENILNTTINLSAAKEELATIENNFSICRS